MSNALTAADYVYLDRAETLYHETKKAITALAEHPATDRYADKRPGIPGTARDLNKRVQHLLELRQYGIAARLIERKVRKAYKAEGQP